MATTISFTRLCWTLAFVFNALLNLANAAATPASSTFVRGGGPSNVTLSLNVPQNSTDNLFFHFNGPASASWVAFGFGSQMAGSLMFVAYASGDGKNVTVSPRIATGHGDPVHTPDVTVSLFEGSGIQNRVFSVNAMCTGCRSWNGGSLDITDTGAPMIWAIGPAWGLTSNDLSAPIRQHQIHGNFIMDLKQATGIGGVPGLAGNTAGNTTGSTDGGSSDSSDGPPGFTNRGSAIHALVMVVSFLIIFPGGYLFLRVFEKVWLHMSIQSIGAFFVVVGAAAGIAVSKKDNIHPKIDTPHQIIGLLVLILVIASWALGLISHIIYKRTQQPAKLILGHRVLGPLCIVLGLINVGIGFNLAGNNRPIIPFVVVTIIMIGIVTAAVLFKRRRNMRKQAMNTPAAMNFREGQGEEGAVKNEPGPPAYSTPAVPLQSYQPSGQEQRR